MFGKKLIIKIHGMSCSHCAKRVEDALEKLDNVKKVKVNLQEEKGVITYKDNIDIEKVKKVIENLDYQFEGVEE